MKKIILFVFLIIGLAFSTQAMAQPAMRGGLPYVLRDSCTSWTMNNVACIDKATKVVCIGNGSACVDIGVGSVSDTAYDATSWDNVTTTGPSKNAVRDKFEALAPGGLLQGIPIIAAGGTADAITATYSPAITLADKTLAAFVALGANTITTPSFTPNSLASHTIVKQGGVALVVGDIPRALYICLLEYNLANTRWELLNPAFPQTTISGNAGTASALASDPAGCTGGQVTNDINAAGVSSCTSWTVNILTLLGAADFATFRTSLGIGKGYLWIPAGTMVPITSAGLAVVNQNPNMTDYLAFDGATDEYAGFTLSLEDWDLSTIKAKFVWYASAAMTNAHTVIWGLNCYAVSDGDTSDVAFSSGEITVSDAYVTADETGPIQKTSAATAAITVQGTPAAGDVVYCRVSRDADTDTSTIDAWLVGLKIEYGKTGPTAW